MQLWYAPTSPFARKVRIAAAELGVPLDLVMIDPWSDPRLRQLNPLSKVPTLVRDDGRVLYESGVICEYLEDTAGSHQLFPPSGEGRWTVRLLHGLADGLCTSAGRLFADERRAADQRSEATLRRFGEALGAGLDHFDTIAPALRQDAPSMAEVAIAAFAGYLDFRWPERDWRRRHAALAGWYESFASRPSMRETRHHLIGQPAP